jgi:hypothetical protein
MSNLELVHQKRTTKLAMIHAAPRRDKSEVTAMTRLWMWIILESVGAANAAAGWFISKLLVMELPRRLPR